MRILHEFEYERPSSLEDALSLLAKYGDKACPLAGGTDLVIGMKYRSMLQMADAAKFPAASRAPKAVRPEVVVSLADIPELKGIHPQIGGRSAVIGPRTTMTEIATYDVFPPALLALRDAARAMGSPLIRNQATIGGNIVHGRPAADTAVATLALGARYQLASARQRRWVKSAEFFTGPGENVRRADELLVAIQIPCGLDEGSAYHRQGTRRQLEIALASAAAWVRIDPSSGEVTGARIGMGAVGPTPLLAPKAAQSLVGKAPSADNLAAAAATARTEIRPIDDFRGSAAYRVEIVEVLVRRALETAVSRTRDQGGRR
jgi:CO/xanthine dehydrogenase FAD-binding subunit